MTLRKKLYWATLVGAMCSLWAITGFAQDDVAGEDSDIGDVSEEATDVGDEAPSEDISADSTPAPAEDDYLPRFRWGIHGLGGPLVGEMKGGVGGLDARFGAQIKDIFGVYAQPIFVVGAGVSADNESASATGVVLAGTAVMAEFDFIDMIYVGLGPEILAGAMAKSEVDATSASAEASTGPYFSIATRAGLAFGSKTPKRRSTFSFGLDMHLVFYGDGVAVLPMIALGYDRF